MDLRAKLSALLVSWAEKDPRFIMLSGDHGYTLFDELRKRCPSQFLNVGVAEQMMVGLAAGLAKQGFRPCVYGLSAFIPIRVLEQIKLDVCFSKLPVTFLGDGAGLVYSTLGASHQCAEDIACLRPLPHIDLYSPADSDELEIVFSKIESRRNPAYIRVGKSDRGPCHETGLNASVEPHFVHEVSDAETALISFGSMLKISQNAAAHYGLSCISVPQLKPIPEFKGLLDRFKMIIVIEEHSQFGGLTSLILEEVNRTSLVGAVKVHSLSLEDHFSERCGSYQYALGEHRLSDDWIMRRLERLL